ncbi:MAG TPA: glycosyl hydrolase family 28 protein [Capsulimonadaceae bacterium]|jgi:hypothetical protein
MRYSDASLSIYAAALGAVPSSNYEVTVNGQPVFVHECAVGSYAIFSFEGIVSITVTTHAPIQSAVVRPQSRRIESVVDGASLTFAIDQPGALFLEVACLSLPLMIFANPLEADVPDADDPSVRYFAAGRIYDAGLIELTSNETLYIEGGSVVKGWVHSADSDNVSIRGRGVLDGSEYPRSEQRQIHFESCRNVAIEGIASVGTPCWNTVIVACDDVAINNTKHIGWVVGSDGIDICGSNDVHITHSFFHTNDDCVVIKATPGGTQDPKRLLAGCRNVRNVLIEHCVMYNNNAGNVMEIGFETRCNSISGIAFRDIDVIGGHGEGGVFTIHNGDRATISDVLYEDIRVEHFYDKLVDFRIMHSRW